MNKHIPTPTPAEYSTLLVRLQVALEHLMKILSIIVEGLPDPGKSSRKSSSEESKLKLRKVRGTPYIRTYSTREALKYLVSNPALPKKSENDDKQELCIAALTICIGVINKLLIHIDVMVNKLKQKYTKSRSNKLSVFIAQLEATSNLELRAALNADNNSVLYKPKDSPDWTQMEPYYAIDVNIVLMSIGKWRQEV